MDNLPYLSKHPTLIILILFVSAWVFYILSVLISRRIHKYYSKCQNIEPNDFDEITEVFTFLLTVTPMLNLIWAVNLLFSEEMKIYRREKRYNRAVKRNSGGLFKIILLLFLPLTIYGQSNQDSINVDVDIRLYDLEENMIDLFVAMNIQDDIYDYKQFGLQTTLNLGMNGVGLIHSYDKLILAGEVASPTINSKLFKLGLGMELYENYIYNYSINAIFIGIHVWEGEMPNLETLSLELGCTKRLLNNYLLSLYYDIFNHDVKIGFGFKF